MMSALEVLLGSWLLLCAGAQQQYFRVRPRDTSVVRGAATLLPCHVANQAGGVQWSKDGMVLGFDPDIPGYPRYSMVVDSKRGVYNLRLQDVELEDEGIYQCQVGPATNNLAIRAEAAVQVLVAPTEVYVEGVESGARLELREAERTQLTCASGPSKPATNLIWLKNDEPVRPELTVTKVETEREPLVQSYVTLNLYVIMDDDNVTYSCQAEHPALTPESDKLSSSLVVIVQYPPGPPEIEGYHEGEQVEAGDTLTLACISRGGHPPAHLVWLQGPNQVDASFHATPTEVTNTLTLKVSLALHGAQFRCEAVNAASRHPRVASVTLDVKFGPAQLTVNGPRESRINETVTLTCRAGPANPSAAIVWAVDGRPAGLGRQSRSEDPGGWYTESHLTFNLTHQESDVIRLRCTAENEVAEIHQDVTFTVVYPPSRPDVFGHQTPLRVGDTQKLICVSIGGNPRATLRWFKRDKEIKGETSYNENGVTSHILVRVDRTDNGVTFKCEASNQATEEPYVSSFTINVLFPPSLVTLKAFPFNPREGDLLTLECEAGSSNPAAVLTWRQESRSLAATTEVGPGHSGGYISRSRLLLNATAVLDGVRLACEAANRDLETVVEKELTIQVKYAPQFEAPESTVFQVLEGDPLTINATARARPLVRGYTWRRRGLSDVRSRGASLALPGVRRQDAGWYRCEATSDEGTSTLDVQIDVLYGAEVTLVTTSGQPTEGDTAYLECVASGNPVPRLAWAPARGRVMAEPGRAVMTLENISRADAGHYRCSAFNGIGGESTAAVQLMVQFQPVVAWVRRAAGQVGGSVELGCGAWGYPALRLQWPGARFGARTAGSGSEWESWLTVRDIAETDYRNYTCLAQNDLGQAEATVALLRPSVPEAPSGLRATNMSGDGLWLAWSPGFDGGRPQRFEVRWGHEQRSVTEPRLRVEALRLGQEYTFQLWAENSLGRSALAPPLILALSATDLFQDAQQVSGLGRLVAIAAVFAGLLVLAGAGWGLVLRRRRSLPPDEGQDNKEMYRQTDKEFNEEQDDIYKEINNQDSQVKPKFRVFRSKGKNKAQTSNPPRDNCPDLLKNGHTSSIMQPSEEQPPPTFATLSQSHAPTPSGQLV